jgi:hypothetical protein
LFRLQLVSGAEAVAEDEDSSTGRCGVLECNDPKCDAERAGADDS